jgi:hypothetical protein
VEANNGHVLLTSTLLSLHESCSSVEANQQATRNLGVKGTTVTGLLASQDTLDPGHNLVTRRVDGLIEIHDTIEQMLVDGSRKRRAPVRQRSVMPSANV